MTFAAIYFRFIAYRVDDVLVYRFGIMLHTIFQIISYCTLQFHLHVFGSVAEVYRLHMFHRIESH